MDDDLNLAARLTDLQDQVTALKIILIAILNTVGEDDRNALGAIVRTCDLSRDIDDGEGVTFIHAEAVAAIQVALDDILHGVRDAFSIE